MVRGGVYAVAKGRRVGVFNTWVECEAMVTGYPGARYKKFSSTDDAHAYVAQQPPARRSVSAIPALGSSINNNRASPYPSLRPNVANRAPFQHLPTPSAPPAEEASHSMSPTPNAPAHPAPSAPPADELPGPLTQAAATIPPRPSSRPRAHFFLFFDGASKGNPGPSGAGAYLLETESREIRWRQSRSLPNGTNNEAEYHGLIIGLEQAATMQHVTKLTVVGDSELVIKQMRGMYRVKAAKLVGLHERASRLCDSLRARECRVSFRHVDRSLNALADGLANDGVLPRP